LEEAECLRWTDRGVDWVGCVCADEAAGEVGDGLE